MEPGAETNWPNDKVYRSFPSRKSPNRIPVSINALIVSASVVRTMTRARAKFIAFPNAKKILAAI